MCDCELPKRQRWARIEAGILEEAAGELEAKDPIEWALAGQMAGCDAAQMLRDMARGRLQ